MSRRRSIASALPIPIVSSVSSSRNLSLVVPLRRHATLSAPVESNRTYKLRPDGCSPKEKGFMRWSLTMGSLVVLLGLGLGAAPVAAQDLAPCPSWDAERAQMVEAVRQGAAALQLDLLGNAGPTFRL